MLVLTRRVGESIVLPEHHVSITPLEIRDGKVRIGINAPKSVLVHRQEVWLRLCDASSPSTIATNADAAGGEAPA